MTITPETTLIALGAELKKQRISLRVLHLGDGYMVHARGSRREVIGYGRDLSEATADALRAYEVAGEGITMPQAAPI
jgi:hypothetical protein